MAYQLKTVTIRTDNTEDGMRKITELWQDITSGKLPVLFNSDGQFQEGLSPVARYSNYQSNEKGDYDLSIVAVTGDFFQNMEKEVQKGQYKKYEVSGEDLSLCARKAWEQVWREQQTGVIQRVFSEDYESTVPAEYAKDGKAHCYLYIAI